MHAHDGTSPADSSPTTLARTLKNRHIQMIALGGAIGTGLFYGSAASIHLVGPGIILSYLIGGLVIWWIMRMLGEMSTEEPVAGDGASTIAVRRAAPGGLRRPA